MPKKHLKTLIVFKQAAFFGIGAGMLIVLFSFFANGYNPNYSLTAVGFGIIVAFIIVFGFGMSLSLMEEYTVNCKGKTSSISDLKKSKVVPLKRVQYSQDQKPDLQRFIISE
ncbi:hypothetical protein [Bacillus xiapuensis]|uniref:Uncharacterized protein n=1 Tax=Bacillus xiapuensis TaxID=2014075 RepID=A0ABU6N5X9_9BACI|nr:hypothetical protein [Bacillus xiapuensis]